MADPIPASEIDLDRIGDRAVGFAHVWAARAAGVPADPAAERLAEVLRDPRGLEFALRFVDGVLRPESSYVAGANLARIAHLAPDFLPPALRTAIRAGGAFGPVVPGVVIPIARRVMRSMVGHLIVDASPEKLGPALEELRAGGSPLNLNLLGDAVLGDHEAARRLAGVRALLEREDVDHLSLRISAILPRPSMWAFEEAVERAVERLLPLYLVAAAKPVPAFINIDVEEYRDLDLSVAVFTRLLAHPELARLEAGIVVQAYLPDALETMVTLQDWAAARLAAGGAPIRVRLVKGTNLPLERVEAALRGWPVAPYTRKQDTDANYKRLLAWALTPERTRAVRIGVAGHNLFDIGFAWALALERGVSDRVDFEMLLGMAREHAAAVAAEVGPVRLYTPVVDPREFDAAVGYLVRRLDENAAPENFLSAAPELASDPLLFERERERFLAAVRQVATERAHLPERHRTQNRENEWSFAVPGATRSVPDLPDTSLFMRAPEPAEAVGMTEQVLGLERVREAREARASNDSVRVFDTTSILPVAPPAHGAPGFQNAPDTDPSLAANRAWARRIIERAAETELGLVTADAARLHAGTPGAGAAVRAARAEGIREGARAAGAEWALHPAADRSALLRRAGFALAANRDRLLEIIIAEVGVPIIEADAEISAAVDLAHYYAATARELDSVRGARFHSPGLFAVLPAAETPISSAAGGVLSAIGAGSGAVLLAPLRAPRTTAVVAEALWEAGIPTDLLRLIVPADEAERRALATAPGIDRVLYTGTPEGARALAAARPDLPLLGELGGKNAIIVMPSADLDAAAADVARSAFGRSGQAPGAAGLVILVGRVARSERFRVQLADIATTLRVGPAIEAATDLGPLADPSRAELDEGLARLHGGESWLLEPRPLDDEGALWSPGIRDGIEPGSPFHRTEYRAPVLGIMHASTLREAVRYANLAGFGLAQGLHTLEPADLAEWAERIEAGNLFVNRPTIDVRAQRQPLGGWGASAAGNAAKAGGPNHLLSLGDWSADGGASSSTLHLRGLDDRIRRLIEAAQPALSYERFDVLRRAALSDAIAWGTHYDGQIETAELAYERNLLRYLPVPTAIRAGEGAELGEVLRVIIAAMRSGSRFSVSLSAGLPATVRQALGGADMPVWLETDEEWVARIAGRRVGAAPALAEDVDLTDLTESTDIAEGAEDPSSGPGTAGGLVEDPLFSMGSAPAESELEAAVSDLGMRPARVRLVGPGRARLRARLAGALGDDLGVAIFDGEVTASGRVELLAYLREQSISITAHRHGAADHWSEIVLP